MKEVGDPVKQGDREREATGTAEEDPRQALSEEDDADVEARGRARGGPAPCVVSSRPAVPHAATIARPERLRERRFRAGGRGDRVAGAAEAESETG
jgi:hypothetical protein